MFNGMTSHNLAQILSAVEPVDLKALALLRQRRPRPGRWFPTGIATRTLVEATHELMAYMQACRAAAGRLRQLPPIPLGIPIEEWPL